MHLATTPDREEGWTMVSQDIKLGTEWEAVGPFPSGMREHPMTASPLSAFLHDTSLEPDVDFARRPYSPTETFPSSMGIGGRVGWSRFTTGENGHVRIKYRYTEVDWDSLRRDHGWAAAQYQCILRTDLDVPDLDRDNTPILIELRQGTEFALISTESETQGPTVWYQGDVYDFASTPTGSRDTTGISNFSRSVAVPSGQYIVVVRAMYEIRMFGDPGPGNAPTIDMCLRVQLDDETEIAEVVKGLRVVPDVVDGRLMGDWISVPLRIKDGLGKEVVLKSAEGVVEGCGGGPIVELAEKGIKLYPGQTRPIAFRIIQVAEMDQDFDDGHVKKPPPGDPSIRITFHLEHHGQSIQLVWEHRFKKYNLSDRKPFLMTFASPSEPAHDQAPSLVSYATLVPPKQPAIDLMTEPPVMLGLHGAGVDVESPFWSAAIPQVPGMWAVLPTGKNEWGEDWHGGSMADAWAARNAVPEIVIRLGIWLSWSNLLVGHSNGGQGAWHLAARYPDEIVGVIAASGWLKIQDYVPYQHLTSLHYADPMLMGILQSALTPYNNDLYASNLAHLPVLAIHGTDDDNVPPRHSREHVALIQAWQGDCTDKKMLVEVPRKGHWWDDVLKLPEVFEFIDKVSRIPQIPNERWKEDRLRGFTLTTANPDECGARSGVRIIELRTPGRLGRLDIKSRMVDGTEVLGVRGTNVKRITYQEALIFHPYTPTKVLTLSNDGRGYDTQTTDDDDNQQKTRRYGPMIRLLATTAPINLIINPTNARSCSIAKRYAHDLYVYHRLAVNIVSDKQAVKAVSREGFEGNVVIIGRPEVNEYTRWMLEREKRPFTFHDHGRMELGGREIDDIGAGLISLLPHPTDSRGLALLIAGNDDLGLELVSRLLPLRTGVPVSYDSTYLIPFGTFGRARAYVQVPEWVIKSPRSRWQATGGFIGAGWYGDRWQFNESTSWLDRP